jgi:hypothetical protein
MARSSLIARLLASPQIDMKLRQVSAGARFTWLKVMQAMSESDVPDRLLLGPRTRLLPWLAGWAALTETEAETHLDELCEVGLLTREGPDGLGGPGSGWRGTGTSPRRAEAARINGLKGGRPRKSPLAAGQPSMLLPIPGGAEASAEERRSCSPGFVGSVAIARASSSEKEAKLSSPDGVTRADVEHAGQLAQEAAGLSGTDYRAVWGWLKAGATAAVIVRVVEARMRAGAQPNHLGYFTKAVHEAIAAGAHKPASEAQAAANAEPADPLERAATARYITDVQEWSNHGCDFSLKPPARDAYREWYAAGHAGSPPWIDGRPSLRRSAAA